MRLNIVLLDGETPSFGPRREDVHLHDLREGLHLDLRPQQTPQRSLGTQAFQMCRLRLQVRKKDILKRLISAKMVLYLTQRFLL